MKILFNGCSFTWGDELENREEHRFSTLVSRHYNASHANISACGVSNDAIARTTMEWFDAGNTCDLAIIQWTVISRIEGYNTDRNEYECVTVQSPKKWEGFYKRYYDNQLGVDCVFKNYYILEQYFLKNNIKYLFLFHDRWKKFTPIPKDNGKQQWTEYDVVDTMIEIPTVWRNLVVNKNFHFIAGNEMYNGVPADTLIIYKPEHYVENGGHPSKLGHQKIAEYIIDNIVV